MATNQARNDDSGSSMLREVLALAHPLMAEAIYLAAIPHWYDLPLFSAVRDIDDQRNEGLIPRLEQYSFVVALGATPEPTYRVRKRERLALHRMWIDLDAAAYTDAHQRAFAYLDQANTEDSENDPARDYERLYHLLFVDLPAGASELIRLFQRYAAERRLGAIEFLLDGVDEASDLLSYLAGDDGSDGGSVDDSDPPPTDSPPSGAPSSAAPRTGSPQSPGNFVYFRQLQRYLRANLLELRGHRTESKKILLDLRRTPDLAAELRPYIGRTFAALLRAEGKFVEAIDELKTAISRFQRAERETQVVLQRPDALERAMTMVALGDTYVEFARSARGESRRSSVQVGMGRRIQRIVELIASAPLLIYLSFYLGRRVWHPDFWMSLYGLDWIVARLFALGAQQYQQAAPFLHQLGAPEEKVLADEKAADLFLEMGDVVQANHRFHNLLEDSAAPLGPYRRLRVRLSLAETQIELQRPKGAQRALQEIIPQLEAYADDQNVAHAYALLAEAALRNQEYDLSRRALADAVTRYQALESLSETERIAEATNVQERMQALAALLDTPSEVQAEIEANGEKLSEKRYTAGYHHPAYVAFRRVVLFLLPLALVLVYLTTIQLETEIGLEPAFSFRAAPILNPGDTQPRQLSQGITAAALAIHFDPDSLLPLTVGALLLYLLIFAALGVWIIQTASLTAVQERARADALSVYPHGIGVGDPQNMQTIRWEDVRRVVLADTALWKRPIASASSVTIHAVGKDERAATHTADQHQDAMRSVTIRGTTNWYHYFVPRLRQHFSKSVDVRNLNQSVFRSLAGALYLLSTVIFLLIALFAGIQTWGEQLWLNLPLTPYSIADLYPYLYLALVLLPIWWAIVRPIQITRYIGAGERMSLFWLVSGSVLAVFLVARSFRPLLTVPDLYPPLFVIVTIVAALWLLWHASPRSSRADYLRLGTATLAGAAVCVVMISFLARDVYAYHLLITGNTQRDLGRNALRAQDYTSAQQHFDAALQQYDRALTVSARPLWIVQPLQGLQVSLGLPRPTRFTWVLAIKNAAALHAQQGQGDRAVALYTQLMEQTGANEELLTWRAMARQRAATQVSDDNRQGVRITRTDLYREALADYAQAIALVVEQENGNLTPWARSDLQLRRAQFVLWRGLTSHSLEENDAALADYETVLQLTEPSALTTTVLYTETVAPLLRERALSGMGWLAYDEARDTDTSQGPASFQRAATLFEQAIEMNPKQEEAWLGLGYANYSAGTRIDDYSVSEAMDAYAAAMNAWTQASMLDPTDPVVHISLGTLHWKLALFVDNPVVKCREYSEAIRLHYEAVDTTRMRPQRDEDLAHSYRTIGRIYYLLGNCQRDAGPEYDDKETVYQSAIDSFTQAIALDPTEAEYPQVRGRYAYALWTIQSEPNFDLLYQAIDDLTKAAAMGNPATTFLNATRNALVPHAVDQANEYLDEGNLQDLMTPLRILVTYDTNAAEAIRERLHRLLSDPSPLLLKNADLESDEAQQQIQQILDDLLAIAPSSWSFDRGLEAATDMQPGIAIPFFEIGLGKVQTEQDLTSAQNLLIAVSTLRVEPQTRAAIVREFRRALPRIEETVQRAPTVHSLITLGTIAAVAEDMERAGRLYAQAIQLNSEEDNTQYNLLRRAWEPLLNHWRRTGSTAPALLAAFDQQLDAQVASKPDLDTAEFYWGVRAWFKYWLGRSAFRAEDEAAARAILDSAQQDADRAFAAGTWEGTNTIAHLYLREAAWAWYHIERGDERYAAGNIAGALEDYRNALRENRAVQDSTARAEKLEAARKTATTALELGDEQSAAQAYHQLVLATAVFDQPVATVEAGAALRDRFVEQPDLDLGTFYAAFRSALPSDSELAQLSSPTLYWRHRAGFGFNDNAVAALYRQRGDNYFDAGEFASAVEAYTAAAEQAPRQEENVLDAQMGAGIASLALGDSSNAAAYFDAALSALAAADDLAPFVSVLEDARSRLADVTGEDPAVVEVRAETLAAIDELLEDLR